MGGFIKGMLFGAIVPGIFAYLARNEAQELRAERSREVAAIEYVVESTGAMDKSVGNLVRGINVLQMGCEYRNGEDPQQLLQSSLKRQLGNYETARNGVYSTLDERAATLQQVLGKTNSARLKGAMSRVKEKGTDYAEKIF